MRKPCLSGFGGVWLALLMIPLANVTWGAVPALGGEPTVRFGYLIPSNRTPQPNAVETLQVSFKLVHSWYAEEMLRWGFGLKSFRYETESDGVTPKVHVINVSQTDDYIRGDIWSRTWSAASSAGVSVNADGEIWIMIPETHLMQSDGSIVGGTALGGGTPFWGGDLGGNGKAMVGSDMLPFISLAMLQDDTAYDGMIVPQIGPYPLVFDKSWAWFLGNSFGSVGSSYSGAIAHEVGHAFGLYHDFRGDDNMHGNLMGNGLRGMRGCVFPRDYSADYTHLTYISANVVNLSPYFTTDTPVIPMRVFADVMGDQSASTFAFPSLMDEADQAYGDQSTMLDVGWVREGPTGDDIVPMNPVMGDVTTDVGTVRPTANLSTSGTISLTDGHVKLDYTGWDDTQLKFAVLYWNGDVVREMPLSGTSVSKSFLTPNFDKNESNTYKVAVFDEDGYWRSSSRSVTPSVSMADNIAPDAALRVPWQARFSSRLEFSARKTIDVDSSTLYYEWQLDDAPFTSPRTNSGIFPGYDNLGVKHMRVRVTDDDGAQTVSTWVSTRVVAWSPADANCDGTVDVFDIDPFVLALVDEAAFEAAYPHCSITNCDVNADGTIDVFDIDPFVSALVNG